jgi:hypothetical protein
MTFFAFLILLPFCLCVLCHWVQVELKAFCCYERDLGVNSHLSISIVVRNFELMKHPPHPNETSDFPHNQSSENTQINKHEYILL